MVIFALSIVILAHLIWRTPAFPFMPDSAAYVSEARRLLAPLMTSEVAELPLPLSARLFPIGFPALLALLFKLGVEPHIAAVAIAWISGVLIPFAIYIPLSPHLGSRRAAIVAILGTLSPGVWIYAGFGLTDVFTLLLSLTTIGIAINARSYRAFFLAGLLAGFSYAIRNAQLALMIALIFSVGRDWVCLSTQRPETTKQLLALSFGMATIVMPIVVRNILIFGSTNAYDMPDSTIGLLQNVRIFLHEFFSEITANRAFSTLLTWTKPGILAVAATSILLAILVFRRWRNIGKNEKTVFFFYSIYLTTGILVTIAARTRYEWGEMINARHMLQYSPFFFAAAAALTPSAALSATPTHLAVKAVIVLLLGSHAYHSVKLDEQTLAIYKRSEYAAAAQDVGQQYFCTEDKTRVFLTNLSQVFRITCTQAGSTNYLPIHLPENQLNSHTSFIHIADQAMKDFAVSTVRIGLFPDNGKFQKNSFPVREKTIIELERRNFLILLNSSRGIIFEKQRSLLENSIDRHLGTDLQQEPETPSLLGKL